MTTTSSSARARTPDAPPRRSGGRRAVRAVAVALASLGAVGSVALVDATPVAAADGELPTNALADEVTASADEALRALDEFVATGDAEIERVYVWHRSMTAAYTARQLGYDESEMIEAWAAAEPGHQAAVLAALTQVGVPYRTNASQEGVGFDCSGLTSWAWARAGVELYHQSGVQIDRARDVARDEAQPGDLVQYPGHIMMYLGVGDAIVHAPQTGRTVEIDQMSRDSVRFGDPTG